MLGHLSNFLRNDSGATAIEYGLIAGLISVVIITAVTSIGANISKKLNTLGNALR